MSSFVWRVLVVAVCMFGWLVPAAAAAQRTVRVSSAWVTTAAGNTTEATAFLVVDNGTMYDVYVVGAESEVAGVVEMRQAVKGAAPSAIKEATVPAFGQLEMAAEGIHFRLAELKRALKTGETVTLSVLLDNGQTLVAEAVVK